MVEQPAVNRFVVGSSPTLGALENIGMTENERAVNLRSKETHIKGCWAVDTLLEAFS